MNTCLFESIPSLLVASRKLAFRHARIFLAGAFAIAGITVSQADQILTIQSGYNALVCQVNGTGGNNINNAAFLQVPPSFSDPNGVNSAVLFVWNCTGYNVYMYFLDADAANNFGTSFGDGWYDPVGNLANVIWTPGKGMFLRKPTPGSTTITMGGTPHVPVLPVTLPCGCGGYNLLGRQTPGTGTYENIIGFPPVEGATVYRLNTGFIPAPIAPPNFTVYTFTSGAWSPGTPLLNIGESAFFVVPCSEDKWMQSADTSTNGLDVRATQNLILADDFRCNATGPITQIRIRGSWLNDIVNTQGCFCLSIWSDIPRVGTNYSRPGQQLCSWCFNPGQYTYGIYASNVNERFYNPNIPGLGGLIGNDTAIWEYVFNVPTNQSCIQSNGNIYWVSVTMDCVTSNQFGWKTCPTNFNDDAVYGHVTGTGIPLLDWIDLHRPGTSNSLDLSFTIITTLTNPPVDNPAEKWLQPPDASTNGLDVLDTDPKILADDFLCTATGPITHVRVWGSWRYDQVPTIPPCFCLGIWSDIPAGAANGFSRPGTELCNYCFGPGQYTYFQYTNVLFEQFFNPNIPAIIGFDTVIWQYDFTLTNACWQTNGTVYWLSLTADCIPTNEFLFGWKTTPYNWNDDAVFADQFGFGGPIGPWQELRRPPLYTNSLDLSFEIITETNTPPPTNNIIDKWLQIPDLSTNGLDVRATDPKILADDFRCNATGPITQIRIWTSWRYDQLPPVPPCFILGIWSDIPASPTNFYSRPGVELCSYFYGPGQYTNFPYASNLFELFFDPNIPAIVGSDTVIWEYVFDIPTNAPCIQTNGNIYWLSISADCFDSNAYLFGWKTCPTNWNDDAVWADQLGFGGAVGPWQELRRPPYYTNSLDLSFEIITGTNPCPPMTITCTNITVPCASAWTNVPPTVYDPCCGTNYTVTYTAVTNGICPVIINYLWQVVDCLGTTSVCNQVVTVVDTVPPVITCATNKSVPCGTFWTFDPPLFAFDLCCTNVTVTIATTFTNNCQATRVWRAVDCCNNTNFCSQVVTIIDTNRPSIVCPTNIVIVTCLSNLPVTWSITATDNCSSVTVTSTPPSGTIFYRDTTNTVTAIAMDACGNTNSCSFLVVVRKPTLTITLGLVPGTLTITWLDGGILEEATSLFGPWSPTPGFPVGSYTFTPSLPVKFYRLRCP